MSGIQSVFPSARPSVPVKEKEKVIGALEEPLFPPHLQRSRKWYRLGYLIAVAIVSSTALTTPRTYARQADGHFASQTMSVVLVGLMLCLVSYLLVQGSDPGYFWIDSSQGPSSEMVEISLQSPMSPTPAVASKKTRKEAVDHSDIVLLNREDSRQDSDTDSDSDSEEEEEEAFFLDIEPDESQEASLNGIGQDVVPMRAKYCKNSRRYVATFDHFCGILGTCIGERNHFWFWWFLFFHTVQICFYIQLVQSGFRDTRAEVGTWIDFNAHALGAILLLSLLLFVVGSLLLFHTFLACSSMTSYEFLRSDKISYLRGTEDFDLPFSNGLLGNLKRFCILDGLRLVLVPKANWTPREWRLHRISRDSEDVWNNVWENKYWSCC